MEKEVRKLNEEDEGKVMMPEEERAENTSKDAKRKLKKGRAKRTDNVTMRKKAVTALISVILLSLSKKNRG